MQTSATAAATAAASPVDALTRKDFACFHDSTPGASEARHDTGGPVKRLTLDEMYAHAETVAKAARSAETNPRQQRDRRLIAKEMMRIINERRGHERTA